MVWTLSNLNHCKSTARTSGPPGVSILLHPIVTVWKYSSDFLFYSNGAVYMCGHLHTLAGFVPQMYSPQRSGYLELELGDWKENRM